MKKALSVLLVALMLLSVLSACSSNTAPAPAPAPAEQSQASSAESAQPAPAPAEPAEDDGLLVGFASAAANVFFDGIDVGLRDVFEPLGGQVIRADADGSVVTEMANIENFITMGCDLVVISPFDSAGSCEAIRKLNDANIPVICTVGVPDGDCEYLTVVKSDDFNSATVLAEWVFEQMNYEGEVVIVEGRQSSDCIDRCDGYIAACEKYGIKIAGSFMDEGLSVASCQSAVENLMTAHPNAKAVLGYCGFVLPGAIAAFQSMGIEDVICVDVDGLPAETDLIKSGEAAHCAVVGQSPRDFGRTAGNIFLEYQKDPSTTFEPITLVPTTLITKDNVDEWDAYSYAQ